MTLIGIIIKPTVLLKAKARPVGSVSPDGKYKKVSSSKWLPIKKERVKGSGIEKSIKKAYDWIFRKTDNKFEAAVILDTDGRVVVTKLGKETSINIDDINQLFKDKILIHNHPSDYSFSDSDIFIALTTGLKEIRAIGKTYEHTYIPNRILSRKDVAGITIFNRFFAENDRILWSKYYPKVDSGAMTAEEASTAHWHEIITRYTKEFGGFYERRKR